MTCEEALVLISGEIDGINTEPETMQLREHLENCEACRALKETLQMVDVDLHELQVSAPEDLCEYVMQSVRAEAAVKKSRRPWRNLAVAAGLMLVIGAMALPKPADQAKTVAPMAARSVAEPMECAVQEETMADTEMNCAFDGQTVTVDPQELADARGADLIVTHEILPEMEVCVCETLENGMLLYHLETEDAAVQLSRLYGAALYQATEKKENAESYALLVP